MVDEDQSTRDCLRMARDTLRISSRLMDEAEASMRATSTIVAECQSLIAEHRLRTEERRKQIGVYGSWFR